MDTSIHNLRKSLFLIAGLGIAPLISCQTKDNDTNDNVSEQDLDADGETAEAGDCDDQNPEINSNADEICDGIDNNCDEVIDTDAVDMSSWFLDNDNDGFGDPDASTQACDIPENHSASDGDCNDEEMNIHPNAEEVCDEVDNNCDGMIDNDATDASTWFPDTDNDGFGDTENPTQSCTQPEGHIDIDGDCNDEEMNIHPSAEEVCDEVDNNCDGMIDNDATDATTWYPDTDNDGFGDTQNPTQSCTQPEGHTNIDGDCNDLDTDVNPDAEEDIFDEIDNNCDGEVDNPTCPSAPIPVDSSAVLSNPQTYTYCSPISSTGSCPSVDYGVAIQAVTDTIGAPPPACFWDVYGAFCGPIETTTECCYTIESVTPSCIAVGRPFLVGGEKRVASLSAKDSWIQQSGSHPFEVDPTLRAELIAHWKTAAQEEHASIASFARLTLQLMALGAPPHLISSSIQAQTDELAHARACLSVVSLLSGEALGPDTLNISSHTSAQPTAEQVLVDSILEGCINETLAAAEAAWLSENCQHPRIRKVLRKIAKDEERHSALGWKVVSWILEENPSYAPLAAQTFATLAQSWEQRLIHPQGNERIAFGQLSQDEARILHAQVWETIIHPCAQSILRSSTQKEQSA